MCELQGHDGIDDKRICNLYETTCKTYIGSSSHKSLARVAIIYFSCCADFRTCWSRGFGIHG